jgi:hypothetical protein
MAGESTHSSADSSADQRPCCISSDCLTEKRTTGGANQDTRFCAAFLFCCPCTGTKKGDKCQT